MDYKKYHIKYISELNKLLLEVDTDLIDKTVSIINNTGKLNRNIFIIGNGGSSSIADHVSVDLVKAAGIKSTTFNNANLITCFANDYGHENWMKEALKVNCSKKDLVILISSSGNSKNIINAARYCKKNNITLLTFSGFDKKNPLRKIGNINFYVNSNKYNFVEMVHHIILVSIVDIFSQKNL